MEPTEDIYFVQMLEMDLDTLRSFCQVDSLANRVCSSPYFWLTRIRREFGDDLLPYKPEQVSYREMYEELMTIEDDDLDYAFEQDRPDLIQYLVGVRGVGVSEAEMKTLVQAGHLDSLKQLNRLGYPITSRLVDYAAKYDRLEILIWAAETFNLYPSYIGQEEAATEGNIDVLQWMLDRGVTLDGDIANAALEAGELEAYIWTVDNGLHRPNIVYSTQALLLGQIDILNWLNEEFGLGVDESEIDHPAVYSNPEAVSWLEDHGYNLEPEYEFD